MIYYFCDFVITGQPLRLYAAEEEERLFSVSTVPPGCCCELRLSPLLSVCFEQLEEYFAAVRREFELPLYPAAGGFAAEVRQALLAVPYGRTAAYTDIAAAVGRPRAQRAVGQACRRNPLLIVVPCHRIIGKNGAVGNYAAGRELKHLLLEMETEAGTET